MIIGSLLLILVAVGLLVAGVLGGSNALVIASIVTTVVAAVVLILGVRQSTSDEDDYADHADYDAADAARPDRDAGGRSGRRGVWRGSIPSQARWRRGRDAVDTASRASAGDAAPGGVAARDAAGGVAVDAATRVMVAEPTREESIIGRVPDEPIDEMDDDPPGEPAAAITSPADAARLATLATEVLVVDGRPRYHVPSCVHLLGRESEPLPVGEALELGFSPCGMCEPDRALLAEARPV